MSAVSSPERSALRRLVLIAVIAAALLLVPTGLVRASGPNGTLRGYITSAATSTVVAGASVQVTASDVSWVFQATTNGAGYYAISLPNHEYTVQVSAPAFDVNSTTVVVGSAETVWNNMSLHAASARTAVIQGYVQDSVSSAAVTSGAVVASTVWWSSEDYSNASALDGTGFYHVSLVPGTYQVSTSGVAGYAPYTSTYLYPSSGSTLWWNISVDPDPLVAWINGTVVDAYNYSTLSGANLTASLGALQLAPVQSNATGQFSLHVPLGTIDITADAGGHAPDALSYSIYSAGVYSPTLYLIPLAASERGWIRNGLTGAPIAGALFTATPFWSSGYTDQATANGAGYFALRLTADDFDLAASAAGYTSWAGYDFLSAGDVVWNNITLWPITSPVQGYVLDGSTGAHLSGIYVYAYDSRSGYSTSAVSDSTGLYSFLLPPSPAMMLRVYGTAPYTGLVAYPDVRPYVTTWANLTLARSDAALDVTVTDGATGLPISPAYVNAYWANGYNYGITNGTGFTAVSVPAGADLTVYASATGYLTAYLTVAAVSGTRSLSVVLNPNLPLNVTVQGYVVSSATLLPISSAVVSASGYNGSSPYGYTDGTGYYSFAAVAEPQTLQATAWQYSRGTATISPPSATTVWVNFSLAPDTTSPLVLNFTATPADNVGPANPTVLRANVNETSLASAGLSIFKLSSSASNIGTFLQVGQIPAGNITIAPSAPGNSSVSSTYDTRTPIATLSDGVSSAWWPSVAYWSPYQMGFVGTFQNATLATPVYGYAVFDTRDGRLLYVDANGAYVDPVDQPTATFTPSSGAYRMDLSTAVIVGYTAVTGPAFRIGTLSLTLSGALSSGEYAAVMDAYDAGSNHGRAAAFFNVTADTTPPVARAGPSQTVDQGATVTLDGSGSTDNTGITAYTWTFTDGTPVVLHGAIVHHVFTNPGVYHVTLTVFDAAGNHGASSMTVTVRDTAPPTVAITAPSSGAAVSGSIGITATAFDNVGVVRVEYRIDGVSIGNATSAPYTLLFNTTALSNGNHTLEAIAFDAAGNSATASERLSVSNAATPGGPGILGLDLMIWVILLIVILVAAGLLVVLVLARRRKPRAPPAVPPPPPPADGLPPHGP